MRLSRRSSCLSCLIWFLAAGQLWPQATPAQADAVPGPAIQEPGFNPPGLPGAGPDDPLRQLVSARLAELAARPARADPAAIQPLESIPWGIVPQPWAQEDSPAGLVSLAIRSLLAGDTEAARQTMALAFSMSCGDAALGYFLDLARTGIATGQDQAVMPWLPDEAPGLGHPRREEYLLIRGFLQLAGDQPGQALATCRCGYDELVSQATKETLLYLESCALAALGQGRPSRQYLGRLARLGSSPAARLARQAFPAR